MDHGYLVSDTHHSGEWQMVAKPSELTIPSGGDKSGRVIFTATNLGDSARLAQLEIEFDPGAAHSSWFSVDTPSIVLAGRTVDINVLVRPSVANLQPDEQYAFGFRGRIGDTIGGEVTVTALGPQPWTAIPSPKSLEFARPGTQVVVYTVRNESAHTATALLEVPDPELPSLTFGERYRLDEAQKTIPGHATAAFTLTVELDTLPDREMTSTVLGRVSTAGSDDYVRCEPVLLRVAASDLLIGFPSVEKLTGKWLVEP